MMYNKAGYNKRATRPQRLYLQQKRKVQSSKGVRAQFALGYSLYMICTVYVKIEFSKRVGDRATRTESLYKSNNKGQEILLGV